MIFSKKTSVTWRTQRIDLKKLPLHKWELLWICGFCQFSFGQFEQWIDQSLLCKKEKIIEYFFPPQIDQSVLWRDGHYFVTWRTLWIIWLKITQKGSQRWFFYTKIDSFPPLFTYMWFWGVKVFPIGFYIFCPSRHKNLSVTSQKYFRHGTKFLNPIWVI